MTNVSRLTLSCLLVLLVLSGGALCSTPAAISPADALFAQAQFGLARKAYAGDEVNAPNDPAPRVGLIRTLLRMDHWDDALIEAKAFAAKFPQNADTHGLLSLALIRAGWQEPYADEAKQSLALDTNDYWGLVASGRAADWDGRTEDARTAFRKASEVHPEWPDAWGDILVLDDNGNLTKEILGVAQTYLKLNPHGHPHDEIAEDTREMLVHVPEFQAAFRTDPPYQHAGVLDADAARGSAQTPSLTVEFLGDYAVFPVTINSIPFRLLFDTGGGSDILLNWNAAKRLHLPVIAHSYVRGVSGKEKSDTLKAQTMTLAGLTYKSIKIETAGALEDTGDGILGGDILQNSVVTLDFEKRTATLAQGSAAQAPQILPGDGSISLPFHFYHGDLYLPLSLNGVPVWALVDTGAIITTLSLRLAQQQLKDVPKEDVWRGSYSGRHGIGSTDQKMEYVASRDESQITLSQTPPVSIPTQTLGTSDADRQVSPSSGCDFEVSLWLGMSSLTYAHRLTFDYPRRLLTFEYKIPDDTLKPKKK